jgi:hypothetical protein
VWSTCNRGARGRDAEHGARRRRRGGPLVGREAIEALEDRRVTGHESSLAEDPLFTLYRLASKAFNGGAGGCVIAYP